MNSKVASFSPSDQCLSHLEPWCFSWAGLEACLRPFWADGGVLPPFFAPRAFYTWDIYRHELLSYMEMSCHVMWVSYRYGDVSAHLFQSWLDRLLVESWLLGRHRCHHSGWHLWRFFLYFRSNCQGYFIFVANLGQICWKGWPPPGQSLQPTTQNNLILLLNIRINIAWILDNFWIMFK